MIHHDNNRKKKTITIPLSCNMSGFYHFLFELMEYIIVGLVCYGILKNKQIYDEHYSCFKNIDIIVKYNIFKFYLQRIVQPLW